MGDMAAYKEFSMGEEFASPEFHSVRPENRFIRTMETLMEQPDKSIWYNSENQAEARAVCRMLGNEGFDREEIIRAYREATIRRMAGYGGTILAVQDTMGVNYNTRVKTGGIDDINDRILGVNVHSCLAVTADGLALGLLDQLNYTRTEPEDEPVSHDIKKTRPIAEKESFRG
jgi:hypothetical protein